MEHKTLSALEFVQLLSPRLDPAALGRVAVVLAEHIDCASPKAFLRFIVKAGLWQRLQDPEFVEGIDAKCLRSHRLVKLAFATSLQPSVAISEIHAMIASGAVDPASPRTITSIHKGIAKWSSVELIAILLKGIMEHMDTFARAGEFLANFLASPDCKLEPKQLGELFTRLLSSPDVRDLAGDFEDLLGHLPEFKELLLAAFTLHHDDSDMDEHGNLSGFVIYTSEEESAGEGSSSSSEVEPTKPPRSTPNGRNRLLSMDVPAPNLNRLKRRAPPQKPSKGKRARPSLSRSAASKYLDGAAAVGSDSER